MRISDGKMGSIDCFKYNRQVPTCWVASASGTTKQDRRHAANCRISSVTSILTTGS